MSVVIHTPIDGEILNRLHGSEREDGLHITVRGACQPGASVAVNGVAAHVNGTAFEAELQLRDTRTGITARSDAGHHEITVFYDRHSFPRYRFSLDDNIRFLQDLAENSYTSLFDNPYMALWRRLHESYGTCIVCNIYFQNSDFDLTMMPDRYRREWADNAHWFKLTFHALQNDPPRPYLNAGYEELARDCDRVHNEILRFAGAEVMDPFTTIHFGEATVEGCRAVRDRGIRGLCGYFQLGAGGTPQVSYYHGRDIVEHVSGRDYWYDTRESLAFVRHAMVCNLPPCTPAAIPEMLRDVQQNPGQGEILELMIHEQYFHPDYHAYLPDYAERCETAVRWVTEQGYRPVLWSTGFVGNPAAELPD